MSVIMYRLKRNGRAAVIVPDDIKHFSKTKPMELQLELIADFQKRRAELNAKMDAVLAEIQAALGE